MKQISKSCITKRDCLIRVARILDKNSDNNAVSSFLKNTDGRKTEFFLP